MEVKKILNKVLQEDLNIKEIIRFISVLGTENAGDDLYLNADKYLKKLTIQAIESMENFRNLLAKLAKTIDELYGNAQQDEFGRELNNYTDQFLEIEESYKKAVRTANSRIRAIDRAKLYTIPLNSTKSELDSSVRNRLQQGFMQQEIDRSAELANDLKHMTRNFAEQTELTRRTVETLCEDSNTLSRTHEAHRGIDTCIGTSVRLVGKYNRRESWDRALIIIAFVFFCSVFSYILIKRIRRWI